MTGISIEETGKEALREEEELAEIRVDGNHIVFEAGHGYAVPLAGCKTHEGILAWTLQLSYKTWITPDLLRRFIGVACNANELHYPEV